MELKDIKTELKKRLPKEAPRLWIFAAAALISLLLLLSMKFPKAEPPSSEPEPSEMPKSVQTDIESRLREMVSKIKGAGEAEVMVTFSGDGERIYAENTVESDGRTEREHVIIGSKEALLKQSKTPEVKGVLVICEGGDSPQTKEKVVNAVATVLDIPTSKVYVTKSK